MAKGVLISALDARLHTRELRFAADLSEAGAMAEELKDFRRKVSDAGRATYAAQVTAARRRIAIAITAAITLPSRSPT